MSRFRTRALEESCGHRELLFGRLGSFEERFHGSRGYLVADGRVGPPAVVHLVLQRGEERLGHRVVVAVAGAAAGKAHVVGAGPLGQRPAGVLRAPVAVENGVSGPVAARFRRFERRHGDVGGHAVVERPTTHHHARAQVDHGGQVQPALAGAKVGDVAHELIGGHGAGEVAAHS